MIVLHQLYLYFLGEGVFDEFIVLFLLNASMMNRINAINCATIYDIINFCVAVQFIALNQIPWLNHDITEWI